MITNAEGHDYITYAARCHAQLVTPMGRIAWERECSTPSGLCDCCGVDVGRLHTVQIGSHTDQLCDGCIQDGMPTASHH